MASNNLLQGIVLLLMARLCGTVGDKVYDAPGDENTKRHAARPTELQFTALFGRIN